MYPSQAPRCEGPDPAAPGDPERCRDGRGRVPVHRESWTEVASASLQHPLGPGQVVQFLVAQSHPDPTSKHGDRRGSRPGLPDGLLGLPGGFQVRRPGQAVGDQGGFEGHNGQTRAQGQGNFGGDSFGECIH